MNNLIYFRTNEVPFQFRFYVAYQPRNDLMVDHESAHVTTKTKFLEGGDHHVANEGFLLSLISDEGGDQSGDHKIGCGKISATYAGGCESID